MNKSGWIAIVLLVVVAGIVVAVLALTDPNRPAERQRTAIENSEPANDEKPWRLGPTKAQEADNKLQTLEGVKERLDHLDWIAKQDWATSDTPALRRTIVADPSEEVQLRAVEVALALASKEGNGATVRVVKTSLASTIGNTRARGLKAAREQPEPALVPTLVELVDDRDPYATMALTALAYTKDDAASAKILSVACDEAAPRPIRERAIALFAVTKPKENEAYDLLRKLLAGNDETYRKLAQEVLKTYDVK